MLINSFPLQETCYVFKQMYLFMSVFLLVKKHIYGVEDARFNTV